MTTKSPKFDAKLVREESGRILAYVVCSACGSRVVGIVQERWPGPGDLAGKAMAFHRMFSKVAGQQRYAWGPLTWPGADVTAHCSQHGEMRIDRQALAAAAVGGHAKAAVFQVAPLNAVR